MCSDRSSSSSKTFFYRFYFPSFILKFSTFCLLNQKHVLFTAVLHSSTVVHPVRPPNNIHHCSAARLLDILDRCCALYMTEANKLNPAQHSHSCFMHSHTQELATAAAAAVCWHCDSVVRGSETSDRTHTQTVSYSPIDSYLLLHGFLRSTHRTIKLLKLYGLCIWTWIFFISLLFQEHFGPKHTPAKRRMAENSQGLRAHSTRQ